MGIRIGRLKLANPVIAASGTFGYGEEYSEVIDLAGLGAIVTKTITLKPRAGNPMPRIAETPSGLLNSIGLQNVGLEIFIEEKVSYLEKLGVPVIVSIAGDDEKEFIYLAKKADEISVTGAIELNLSCPNVRSQKSDARIQSDMFAQDEKSIAKIVKGLKKVVKKPLITKLSPNVTDISAMAKAAEDAGADAVSLVNTFLGMAIDIEKRTPKIANVKGGLSGPCIRPLAVRMVWDVYNAVKIPIIGMGGIMTAEDALEFIIAGATAVAVGTANFVNPNAAIEILEGIERYLNKNNIDDVNELIGTLKL